jgi:hypothetical protein
MSIAREPIQLRDDQLRAVDPTGLDGLCQHGAIGVLSASVYSFTSGHFPPFKYSATAFRPTIAFGQVALSIPNGKWDIAYAHVCCTMFGNRYCAR